MMANWVKPERLFVVLAVVFGILIIILSPPMSTPDDNTHFYNSYTISRGDIFPQTENGIPGKYMPQGVIDFVNNTAFLNADSNYTYTDFYYDGAMSVSEEEKQEVFKNYFASKANPIGYTVPAIGMFAGNVLLSAYNSEFVLPYNLMFFGKLFNLLFYIIVMFFALRITPCYKRTMFLLALMPMSLYQAASLSYDSLLISVCLLLFAYTMRILADDSYQITWRDIIIISLISICLCAVKQAYAPLMLILLAIPRSRFGSLRRYFISIGIVLLAGASAYIIPSMVNSAIYAAPIPANEIAQKEYLMAHIFEFPIMIARTVWKSRVFYLEGFFGKLGQQDINFPPPIVILFYLLLVVAVFYDSCEAKFIRYPFKLLAAAGCLIMIAGSYYMMYIGWTSIPEIAGVGVNYITGVQGRYFIPVAIFGFSLFANRFIKKPLWGGVILERTLFIAPILILIMVPFLLLVRYWI